MEIADLITPERVIVGLRANDKAQFLQDLSRRAASLLTMTPQSIIRVLQAREQLGSTGLGRGFALPHARLEGLGAFFGMFARLHRPIEFQAIDEKPVDLVFLLLIPPDDRGKHVAALAAISRHLRDQAFAARLREARGPAARWPCRPDQRRASRPRLRRRCRGPKRALACKPDGFGRPFSLAILASGSVWLQVTLDSGDYITIETLTHHAVEEEDGKGLPCIDELRPEVAQTRKA